MVEINFSLTWLVKIGLKRAQFQNLMDKFLYKHYNLKPFLGAKATKKTHKRFV